jgi:GT2 family glycosyltransferase
MKLSYVITTRNRREALLRTLEHLRTHTFLPEQDYEIIVVDNGSTDGTGDAIDRIEQVRVISLAENEGVPARNLAIKSAKGKYVAFLGDDVRPMGQAIPQALAYLARHSRTAAVVGRVVLADGSAEAPALPAVIMGGASIVRKSVIDLVGGFAAEFFRQAADYELSFRIWRSGYRIERFEDVQFSRECGPAAKSSEVTCRMDLRNNLILCERYLPRPLRHVYRRDWMRRYALLAMHDGHRRAASTGVKESRVWARREDAVGRKPLAGPAIESIFGLQAQCEAVAEWSQAHGIRRVAIADWGKNMFATWEACRSAGLHVMAVLDNSPAFAGKRYRNIPILPDTGSDQPLDGILISTVNPAQVDDRVAALGARFQLPILRLWSPASIIAPPPNKLASDRDPRRTKIERAA